MNLILVKTGSSCYTYKIKTIKKIIIICWWSAYFQTSTFVIYIESECSIIIFHNWNLNNKSVEMKKNITFYWIHFGFGKR